LYSARLLNRGVDVEVGSCKRMLEQGGSGRVAHIMCCLYKYVLVDSEGGRVGARETVVEDGCPRGAPWCDRCASILCTNPQISLVTDRWVSIKQLKREPL
jgi:hypothetical protein